MDETSYLLRSRMMVWVLALVAACAGGCGKKNQDKGKSEMADGDPLGAWTESLRQDTSPFFESGDLAGAQRVVDAAIAAAVAEYGSDDLRLAYAYGMLADLEIEKTKPARAAAARKRQLEILEKHYPADDKEVLKVVSKVYTEYVAAKQFEVARPYIDRAIAALERQHGTDSDKVAAQMDYIGALLDMAGELAAAAGYYKHALDKYERLGRSSEATLTASRLVKALRKLGRADEAEHLAARYP
ncbi:MAG: hypothetical protein CVU65_08865 [Deltaproteobacteria bacterium HGW-Deltaproteobacteria-22]|jgi:tetratricopeptide (TPR) repeat protein|nr:MAG: hypothetical protein CVU65_08865 [Deltaproteobacteria bacterium HGW-Deltaproteobacteria-22]